MEARGAAARVIRPTVSFKDRRGTITDLFQGEQFDAGAVIRTLRGAVRGNHYHNETVQLLYMVSGRIRLVTRVPGGDPQDWYADAGDLVWTPAHEEHAVEALTDAVFIVLTRGPRAGTDYELDTYRLKEPLIAAP